MPFIEHPSRDLVRKHFISMGGVDWVSAVDVICLTSADLENRRADDNDFARDLLEEGFRDGLFVPGYLTAQGLEFWSGTWQEWFKRAAQHIATRSTDLTYLEEDFWLKFTSKGLVLAQIYTDELYPSDDPETWLEI